MDDNPNRLEYLSNEIFFEIFEYLDGRHLYRAFYNLNLRINILLQSLNKLCLTLPSDDNDQDFDNQSFSSSVHTLIVNTNANITLDQFPNLRRLIVHWLPANILDKFKFESLPDLSYLWIDPGLVCYTSLIFTLDDIIFTNIFPHLQFCYLPNMAIEMLDTRWSQAESINVLKIGRIDLLIYQSILSLCPNLHCFECAITLWSEIPTDIKQHLNMKTLVLKQMSFDHQIMNMCLSCVPNIRRLDIHAIDYHTSAVSICLGSDWFHSIIDLYLSKLRRMNIYLRIVLTVQTNEYILNELEKSFNRIEITRYQRRLILNRKDFPN